MSLSLLGIFSIPMIPLLPAVFAGLRAAPEYVSGRRRSR
jgi:hypothetical protein